MAITKEAELELLRVINGYNNDDKSSTILPNPKFKQRKSTTFINDINSKLGVTDTKIIDLHVSSDVQVVVANYSSDSKGVLAYYNPQQEIYEILSTFNTGKIDTDGNDIYEDFYPFKITKLNRQNFLYGLNAAGGKVNFFLTSDLMSAVGILPTEDFKQESFFSALFDIETEIVEKDKVTIGNALFADYEKIGFNQDAFNNDLYSFVLWKDNGDPLKANEVQYVKFTAELSQQEANVSDWQINEAVGEEKATNGTGVDFKGISNIDVLSGEETLDSGETSLGSIMFSTQLDAGSTVPVPYNQTLTGKTDPPFSAEIIKFIGLNPQPVVKITNAIDDVEMQKILKYIKDIYNNPSNIINSSSGSFTFGAKYINGTNIKFNLTNENIKTLVNANDVSFKWKYEIDNDVEIIYVTLYLDVDGVEVGSNRTGWNATRDNGNSNIYAFNTTYTVINSSSKWSITSVTSSFDFTSSIVVDYISNQIAAQENTTSQIVIGKDDKGQTYRTAVSQSNSYEGNEPVFIAPRKAFVPLKSKTTGQYAIYEFNGVIGTTQLTTFWNDIAQKDFTATDNYKKVLTEPQSITSVTLSGGNPLPTSDYSLDITTGELTIKVAIASGTPIVVEYKTVVGVPRKVNLTTTTQGSDIYIAGIEDNGELSNTGVTIVGAGDNSLTGVDPTRVFGFNLYRSTPKIDYDEISEVSEDIDFKVAHVKGYRQKNLIFISAYNDDYSEVIQWVQIYPDSFKPYTYLPYANPDEYFALERFNQNKQRELATSVFDREWLDIGISGNTILATTTATNTDLNNKDNDISEIFGHTNEPLFTFDNPVIKERNEVRAIQFTLNSTMVDRLQDKEVINDSQGELLTQLFGDKNKDAHNLIALDQLKITYANGTIIQRDVKECITLNEVDLKLEFGLSIVDKTGNSVLESLVITNKNGDDIITMDLTQNQCIGGVRNINFDILLSENKEGIKYDYARLDETGYDKPYEPIINAKGGK